MTEYPFDTLDMFVPVEAILDSSVYETRADIQLPQSLRPLQSRPCKSTNDKSHKEWVAAFNKRAISPIACTYATLLRIIFWKFFQHDGSQLIDAAGRCTRAAVGGRKHTTKTYSSLVPHSFAIGIRRWGIPIPCQKCGDKAKGNEIPEHNCRPSSNG